MKELRELAEKRDNFVIAGDMNAFKREKEIKELEQVLGREIIRPGKTFPACDPTEELDLIASSENITVENSNILEESFSDHKPITFEIHQY